MKTFRLFLIVLFTFLCFSRGVFADDAITSLRLKTNFKIWKVNLSKVDWVKKTSKLSWNGFDVKLPDTLDMNSSQNTLSYLQSAEATDADYPAIKEYLEKVAVPELNRSPQDVTISFDEAGKVKFDGFAFNGQEVDFDKAFYLIRKALRDRIDEVRLPLTIIPAKVNVLSDDLKQKGIAELISTGETDFSNSPNNRRINIKVGLAAFNGRIVPPDTVSGAGEILGRVDGSTGYMKELVIKGDETIPEFGGGLCQVSTTVYRSLLIGGFPILERTNHSYAVSYYDPQGLDATIYPPDPDMKFKNDTPNSILLQTTTVGNKAYSNVYGTRVDRQTDLIGPWYYDFKNPPPARTKYTEKLAPGEKKKLGEAHGGFTADWYRRITYGDPSKPEVMERIHSYYEPRPLYTLIGIEPGTVPPDGSTPKNLFEAP